MSTLSPSEAAQLGQTIEMFEVITQSQPQDYQSLEILKEAYSKLGRDQDVIKTSRRIAEAYVQLGQLSSAILEYETILQRFPNDSAVLTALKAIESRANNVVVQPALPEAPPPRLGTQIITRAKKAAEKATVDDGQLMMRKVFVDTKIISAGDFDLCWNSPDPTAPPNGISDSFVQVLADKGILPLEKALKILVDKSRLAYLPLDKYDTDMDLTRSFPAASCRRWCVLPFDRMSKTVMVATANPFNQQAARELKETTPYRLVWYVASPADIAKNLQKVFR